MRKIYIVGEITIEAFEKFSRRMFKLEGLSDDDINITLCSDGGLDYAALAFYDRIRASPCQVNIIATGFVASAATLILVAGDNRRMTESSWCMVHESLHDLSKSIKTSEIEREVANSRRMETQWARLFASCTKVDEATWLRLNADETYLTANQCLELGVIDEII